MPEADPDGVVADAKDRLQFLQRGVGVLLDMRLKLGGIQFAPSAPTGLGRQRFGFGRGKIAINRAFSHPEAPGGFRPGATLFNILHHPLPQFHRVGFHAQSLPHMLPMSM